MILMDIPRVSLALAGTFPLYAVLRKRWVLNQFRIVCRNDVSAAICSSVSHLDGNEWARLFFGGGLTNVFAIFAGIITVVPLIFFHKGNQLLSLTMSSLLLRVN